jgi:uncharacterized BrkB/YihY/UPF0761 family membrane protein
MQMPYVYFTAIFMTIPSDVSNSKPPSKLADKRVWLILVIAVAVIIFASWLFFISGYNLLDNSEKLPRNCFSLNGKQICPNS